MLGGHTVTLVDPPERGRHGDPLPGDPAEVQVPGCYVQQSGSTEDTAARDTRVTGLDLFLPPGVQVTARHRVRWRGALYDVDGEPDRVDDVSGAEHHVEVRLRRVTG